MGSLSATILSLENLNVAIRSILAAFSLRDVFDILLTAVIIGGFLVLFRKTKSTWIVVTSIAGFTIFYLVAYYLNLYTVLSIVNAFLGGVVVILVIVFQKELRRFAEWINIAAVRRRFSKRRKYGDDSARSIIEIVASAAFEMARRKVGGLIVFPGKESISSFVSGGFDLDGKVSDPLLLSIFDTSSPGHDGAVVIEEDVIKKFGVVLPLSERDDYERLQHLGTRHRSALGLVERTDALCVVISEEKKRISVAFDGAIEAVETKETLEEKLRSFLNVSETNVPRSRVKLAGFLLYLKNRIRDALLAIALAIVFWLIISYPQSGIIQKEFIAPIVLTSIPNNATVERLTTLDVTVLLSGSEKDFELLNENSIKVVIDVASKLLNDQTRYVMVALKPDDIQRPSPIKLIKITPAQVEFKVVFK
jgi:uncharacterized protein (TIGR00159 family)